MSADNAIFILETIKHNTKEKKFFVLNTGFTQIYEDIIEPKEDGDLNKVRDGIQEHFIKKGKAFDSYSTASIFAELLLNDLDICEHGIIHIHIPIDMGIGEDEVFSLEVGVITYSKGEFQLTAYAQSISLTIQDICSRVNEGIYIVRRSIDEPGYFRGDYLICEQNGIVLAYCMELFPSAKDPGYRLKNE